MNVSGSAGTPDQFDDDLDALADLLAAEGIDAGTSQRIAARAPGAPVPMSFSQELIWLLDRATPGMTAYNMPIARRLRGQLDQGALERALGALVARHEALRSRLVEVDGSPRQLVDAPAPFSLRVVDLSGMPDVARQSETERVIRTRARTPFDLAHEHLFRATLVSVADDEHVLLLETHHIVVDGWSLGILFRELEAAYAAECAGRAVMLPPLPIQYGDYAVWQRAHLAGDRLQELLTFWRGQLGDATEPLDLPTDHRRSGTPTFTGARESIVLPAATLNALKSVGQSQAATLYMVLLSAYATVLHRYTGRENVLVGSGSAGRTIPETEGLVGYLNNTLVQRADLSGDPAFSELLRRVRSSAIDAYDHQDVPLEKLVLELRQGDTRLSLAPLFEVVLTMQDTISSSLALEGLSVEPIGADLGATKFDMTLLAGERDGELALTVQYRSDLYLPETMRRFMGHLRAVLEAVAADSGQRISELPLLQPDERAQLAAWNATSLNEGTATTLVELFEGQAGRVPGRAAIVAPRPSATAAGSAAGTVALTFAELNARANQLAHHLRTTGVTLEGPVGLLLDRSTDALVALIGILKSGGAYVPLSVDAPAARIAQQLAECGAGVVVTSVAYADRLPPAVQAVVLDQETTASLLGALPQDNLPILSPPQSLAYVLFTSGSTGTPKGVEITHANAVHYARAVSRVLADVPSDRAGDGLDELDGLQFGMASTLAADLGNTSLLTSLLAGSTLHLLGKSVTTEPTSFAQYMSIHELDVLKLTPNHLLALAAGKTGGDLAALLPRKWIVVGGEALRQEVAQTLLAAGKCRVLNHYGPTETTVGVCTFEVTEGSLAAAQSHGAQTVPIGRPLSNTRAYVLDAWGNEQPVGVAGELWLGGDGVARGYFKRPDLTRERFVELRNERAYRTGDRVRRLTDGAIEFLGRTDDQVKVRGFRVELGEIALVLRSHPGVENGVVVLRDGGAQEPHLVAYVVARQAGYAVSHTDRPTPEKLAEWLATQLPEYMVPSSVVLLERLPLTANGKVDVAALPASEGTSDATAHYVEPRTETERQLAHIWAEVLKRDRIGLTDNFLTLGGHSLMAIRVLGKISKVFGVRLSLRTLFESPTVEQLAVVVEDGRATSTTAGAAGVISPRSRDAYRIGKPATGSPGSGPAGEGGPL